MGLKSGVKYTIDAHLNKKNIKLAYWHGILI